MRLLSIAILSFVLISLAVLADDSLLANLRRLENQPTSGTVENANLWRQQQVVAMFEDAGAKEVRTQPVLRNGEEDTGLPVHNVIVRLEGDTADTIVVGAHLDKHHNGKGQGAVDDWSGVVAVVDLFRQLKALPERRHTFVFVAFAYEEQYLWGAHTFVNQLSPSQLESIQAMVNLECLGVSGLHIWRNGSDADLIARAEQLAAEREIMLVSRDLPPQVIADSLPFRLKSIPTITFDSLEQDDFPIIHTDRDTLERINPETLRVGVDFAAAYLKALDG